MRLRCYTPLTTTLQAFQMRGISVLLIVIFALLARHASCAPSQKQRQQQRELSATDALLGAQAGVKALELSVASAARVAAGGSGAIWSALPADAQQRAVAAALRAAAATPLGATLPRFMRAKTVIGVAAPSPAAAFGAMYDATTGLSEPSVRGQRMPRAASASKPARHAGPSPLALSHTARLPKACHQVAGQLRLCGRAHGAPARPRASAIVRLRQDAQHMAVVLRV